MVRLRRAVAGAAFLIGLLALAAPIAGNDDHVTRLQLIGVIDQINATYIEEGIGGAADSGAVAILIEIDSPGGELTSMDRIVQAILGSEVPVITWVTPEGARAGSAATMITLAGDVAAMSPNTNIGAASVIGGTGEDLPQTLGEKITNDQVARITELARAHGRNEDWAESAVREAASIAASGAVAMRPPVVDLLAATTDELFAAIDLGARADGHRFTFNDQPLPTLGGLSVVDAPMNLAQQFLHVLSDPNIAFILFTIGFYGILAELFHPNFFSGPVGAIAIVLAFIGSNSLPLNVGGLLLILLGIGLFVLEVNVTSHGLLAIGGIVCFTLGAFALYTRVDENTFVRVEVSPLLVAMLLAVSLAYFGILVRGLLEMRRRSVSALPVAALQGAIGTAQTLLAPAGIAYAGGESWSARSRGGEIAPGARLRVVGMEGLELIVEPVDQAAGMPPQAES
ncbi:MAG TPA: nodulation protein NfeD [Candidatus Limnocylindria bacterium]|nr:nodulation protein NfeD [Candidatus Limnocylindria bacterium]